jgi:Fic family protein
MAFPPDLHDKRMRWLAALRKPDALAILGLLDSERQLTITSAARATGLSARVARSRLDELVAAGIMQDTGSRRPRFVPDGPTWSVLRALVDPAAAPQRTA